MKRDRKPGGCQDCDAYTDFVTYDDAPGVLMMNVYHDDTCPSPENQAVQRDKDR